MCQPALCSTCGKTTWVGCGRHIDDVMAGVRPSKQCTCKKKSLLAKLLGR